MSVTAASTDEMIVATCRDRAGYEAALQTPSFVQHRALLESLTARAQGEEVLRVDGVCHPCRQPSTFVTRRTSGETVGPWEPNWREGLRCERCQMNNRKRGTAWFLADAVGPGADARIYATEQVTPFYRWLRERYPGSVGSEYLGPTAAPGQRPDGRRHEDVERLSFSDGSFDVVVSMDVLEHVNDPVGALREMHRVLAPGGQLLLTVPFFPLEARNTRRAEAFGDTVRHLLPAQYHGNPVSSDGSLVFTDFGWELFDELAGAFGRAELLLYHSPRYGHLGSDLTIFRASKP